MTIKRITAAIAATMAITAIATTTTACDTSSDTPPVSIGSNAPLGGPSNLAGTSTTSKAPKEAAEDQAQDAIRRYYAIYNAVNTGQEKDVNKLGSASGDPLLKQDKANVILRRSKGIESTGGGKIISMRTARTALPEGASGTADVEVFTCIDFSGYKSTRADGSSDLNPNARQKQELRFWVRNASYPDAAGWLVVGESSKANSPCSH